MSKKSNKQHKEKKSQQPQPILRQVSNPKWELLQVQKALGQRLSREHASQLRAAGVITLGRRRSFGPPGTPSSSSRLNPQQDAALTSVSQSGVVAATRLCVVKHRLTQEIRLVPQGLSPGEDWAFVPGTVLLDMSDKKSAHHALLADGTPSNSDRFKSLQRRAAMGAGSAHPVTIEPESDAGAGTGLSPCAALYAKALTNPSGRFEDLPCVPDYPPMASKRVKYLTRGTFVTGNATFNGFLVVKPLWWSSASSGSVSGYYFTGNTFAGTFPDVAAAGVSPANRGGDYSYTASDGVQGRLVGLEVKVKCTTNPLTVAGTMWCMMPPADVNVSSFSGAQLKADPNVMPVLCRDAQEKWITILWRPWEETDIGFHPVNPGTTLASEAFNCMGFWVESTAAQSFIFEIHEFWEFAGQSVSTGVRVTQLTAGHADPVGLARVLEGLEVIPDEPSTEAWVKETSTAIVNAMAHSDTVSRTVKDLLGMAGKVVSPVMGLLGPLMGFLGL